MSHYFTGRFANSYWKSRCRRQDYEWAPNEIDLDLWHHIIDELRKSYFHLNSTSKENHADWIP